MKRRLRAAIATGALFATATGGALALGVASANTAFAGLPSNITFNDNGCTNNVQSGDTGAIAIGMGADQTYAGLVTTLDPSTGLVQPGGATVGAAGADGSGLSPTSGVLQGGTASLTNFGAHGFVPIAFLQAGVNLHVISVGQTINATIAVTVDAANATFVSSGTNEVSVSGPGSGTVVGTGSTVTAPLDAAIQFPDTAFTVPNDPTKTAYFYQANPAVVGALPAGGDGGNPVANGGSGSTNYSAQIIAALGALGNVYIGCLPGEAVGAAAPHTFAQAATTDIHVFAADAIQPAQPPTLVTPQSASANLGGSVIIHALAGATDNVPIDTTSGTLVTSPSHGTATFNPANGDITYQNDGSAGATDTFSFTFSSIGGTSNTATVNISIVAHPASCDVTSQPSCTLAQTILVPVAAGDLTMSQLTGLPTDALTHTLSGVSCTGPAVTLNGQPQFACGAMFPVTVVNARGTDAGWTLSGQVSDLLDPAASPTLTCDTIATANNHCIPGGNVSWQPVAAVAHGIVPGDTAQVTAGPAVLSLAVQTPSVANAPAALAAFAAVPGQNVAVQTNPVTEVAPNGGLHNGAQTLCSTSSGQSGGSFICGAGLVVAVPASAAAPAAPGYTGTLTLTLL